MRKALISISLLAFAAFSFGAPPKLMALEWNGVDVHGSLSQNYYKTSQNDFLIPDSSDGTFEWTEATINALKSWGQWQVGAQALVRDFGDEGNFRLELDWGYVDYAFREELGFRLGKMRLPFGLYAEYRDVDSARMEIIYPQVFNPEDYRAAAAAYQGLGLYGTFSGHQLGSLEYQAYVGNNRIHDDFFLVRRIKTGFNSPSTEMTTRRLAGLNLIWNTPHEGLRFSYTHLNYKGDFNIDGLGVYDDKGIVFNIKWHLVGMEYSHGPWVLAMEYLNRDNDNTYSSTLQQSLNRDPYFDNDNTVSYYATLRRRLNDRLGIYLSYGELIRNVAEDSPPLSRQLKDTSLGFRYDLQENLIFKSQLSMMRGSDGTIAPKNLSPDWFTFASRITWSF